MAYASTDPLFRSLTDAEEASFRRYAYENNPPNLADWDLYHPVCREEWARRGITAEPRVQTQKGA